MVRVRLKFDWGRVRLKMEKNITILYSKIRLTQQNPWQFTSSLYTLYSCRSCGHLLFSFSNFTATWKHIDWLREWLELLRTHSTASQSSHQKNGDDAFYLLKVGTNAHINLTETATFVVVDRQKLGQNWIEWWLIVMEQDHVPRQDKEFRQPSSLHSLARTTNAACYSPFIVDEAQANRHCVDHRTKV